MRLQPECQALPAPVPWMPSVALFTAVVLPVYLLIAAAVAQENSAPGGSGWIVLPSVWLLAATLCYARRFAPTDAYRLGSACCRRLGVITLVAAVLLMAGVAGWQAAGGVSAARAHHLRWLINLVILVPFAEEYFFRGLLLDHSVRRHGRLRGLLLVSLLFALLHAPQGIFFPMFILSLLLGAATLRLRHVMAGVALHLVWNLIVVQVRFGG